MTYAVLAMTAVLTMLISTSAHARTDMPHDPPARKAPGKLADFSKVYRAIVADDKFKEHYDEYRRLFVNLDWNNDGCSGPAKFSGYADNFRWPCIQHDFGYRNNRRVNLHTENTREFVDDQFLHHMKKVCKSYDDALLARPAKLACYGAAEAFYAGVRNGGKSHWN